VNRENAETLSQTQFLLLLHSVPHLGEKSLTGLLRLLAQRRPTPTAFLNLSPDDLIRDYELPARIADYLHDHRSALPVKSAELLRAVRLHTIQLLSIESVGYPDRLERFDSEPPPLLYALGRRGLLDPQTPSHFTFTIAVSNGAAPGVLRRQDEIAIGLVEAGGVPVTGHDRNAYKRLALSAQRRNRSTLYVFDRGLREALGPDFDRPPFSAARIRDAVFEVGRDLALSPFRLDDHGLGANNRRRDELVFALSDIVVALDVRGGGMMMQECLRAHNQGRPVFVEADGRDGNDALRSAGCRALPLVPDWQAVVAANAARQRKGEHTHAPANP
jgi:predicted Rossmann fold nucleotide-binding protein DprA/Smf involved in DNA uptake